MIAINCRRGVNSESAKERYLNIILVQILWSKLTRSSVKLIIAAVGFGKLVSYYNCAYNFMFLFPDETLHLCPGSVIYIGTAVVRPV